MKVRTPNDVGSYITSIRKAYKLSQAELAQKIGKDQRFISKLENSPSSISFGTVMMVLNALNIDIDFSSPDTKKQNKLSGELYRDSLNKKDSKPPLHTWRKPHRKPKVVSKVKS
ncbi:helix-turn-helix domain-containing protein [Alteromonas sp. DY56-G5]|jgi:transcriptional regulator with XRE-family HTH domain|uniref:HTH cro/C1-type domain-containing protein n=2 Tax=Alteromonas TaxID=226 RepID=A0AAC8XNR5_9ALTE|nr:MULTISPECIES: helix-turn-helix domain-containing protein [Alteromonas]AFV87590.1 transcription regulator protein [Alteromonas mediterranea DE1]AGP87627.1 transcriptional regulator [Alteromonas mediterranea U4]AGP99609.1 transcriptional regulator [Alteromonas mediterranea UM7]AMJ80717.1 hypothetical protein AV942_20245 [Alteromonas mediterranea]AMJ84880.1 hypothetical protein AV941_20350 [Alteromonas mediterranea]|tara:strand:- start:776 stop:1117 length:342 start_codon:yes stop_codon:yes gene_type:complete